MGGAGEALLISVIIRALDQASPILRMLGLSGISSMNLLTAAAATTGAAILGIGLYSMKAATTFDYNMSKIAALTTTSAAQMQWYKDQILAMAPQLDQAPTALAQGLYFVISAGYQGADALNILKLSAQAAAATMTPMKDVADLLTTAMNAYRGSNLSAGHAMDDIIKIVVNGKVTMSSLATSFGFAGVTARAAGLSFDEASAAVSTLSQIAGEHGSRRVMMDLDNLLRSVGIDVDAVAKRAKSLGISFDEGKFAAMPFIDKLQYLAKITGGVGYNLDMARIKTDLATGNMQDMALATANANSKFKSLVGGAAAFIPAFMLLSDKGKEYNVILKQMGGNGQATADAFAKMRDSTGQKWNMFKVTLETIATVIGLHLLPFVNRLLGGFIGLGHTLITFLQNRHNLEQLGQTLRGIAFVVLTLLTPAIVGAVVAAMPFLLTVGAIILAGKILGPIIDDVVKKMGGWKQIAKDLGDALSHVRDAVGWVKDKVNDFVNFLQSHQWAMDLFKATLIGIAVAITVSLLPALAEAVIAFGAEAIAAAGAAAATIAATWPFLLLAAIVALVVFGIIELVRHWKQVEKFFQSVGAHIRDALGEVKKWVEGRLDDIHKGFDRFIAKLKDLVKTGFNDIKNIAFAPINAIVGFFDWLYNHNYRFKQAIDELKHTVTKLRDHIEQIITHIKNWLSDRWNDIKRDVKDAWTWIHDNIVQPVQDAIQRVQDAVNGVKTWLLGRWNDIKTDVGNAWSNLMSKAGDVLTQIKNWVNDNVVKPISDTIGQMIKDAEDWGKNLIKSFGKGIQEMGGWLKDTAGSAVGGVVHWLGFHSPSKGLPESAQWGPNLVRMFAAGMLSQASLVSLAAQQVMLGASNAFAGASAPGGAGALAGAGVGAGALLAGAGGSGGGSTTITHQHNWAGAFPNATDSQAIVKAIRQVQQEDYRRGRRAGGYGGLRAGVATI